MQALNERLELHILRIAVLTHDTFINIWVGRCVKRKFSVPQKGSTLDLECGQNNFRSFEANLLFNELDYHWLGKWIVAC